MARLGFVAVFSPVFSDMDSVDVFSSWAFGFRFDAAIAALLALLVWLLALLPIGRVLRSALFAAALFILVGVLVADFMYFDDSGRHLSYELLAMFDDVGALLITVFRSPVVVLALLLFVVLVFFGLRGIHAKLHVSVTAKRALLYTVAIVLFSVSVVRGGINGAPMTPFYAFQAGSPDSALIALNGAYSAIYYSLDKNRRVSEIPMPASAVGVDEKRVLNALYPEKKQDIPPVIKHNVVMIFLESWPAARMASYGGAHSSTPHFDGVLQRGLQVKGMLAGGHRTTEGLFSTLVSYPNPPGQTLADSQLGSARYQSIATILSSAGWDTAFFQGCDKEVAETGSFAQSLGFRQSFGKADIKNHRWENNAWGVHDSDLYEHVLTWAKSAKRPFLMGVNTNTTHDVHLPPGVTPVFGMDTDEQRYLSVLHFADEALGAFLTAYEKEGLGPTLFVIAADHTAKVSGSVSSEYFIPFALFSTDGLVPPTQIPHIVAQRDIAPTVLDILGGATRDFTGHSMLEGRPTQADYYHRGTVGWVEGLSGIEFPAMGSEPGTALSFEQGILKPQKIQWGIEQDHMRDRAIAFYRHSQAFLFRGDSADFVEWIQSGD